MQKRVFYASGSPPSNISSVLKPLYAMKLTMDAVGPESKPVLVEKKLKK
jgi:hypothetical protein